MDDSHRCLKESDLSDMKSDIRVLIKTVEENECKIQRVKDKYELMNDLSKTIGMMSVTLDHIVEHNVRQDSLQEKQAESMENQNKTLQSINQNLNELNQGQGHLNKKVKTLEERVDETEKRSNINILDLERNRQINTLKKYAYPIGAGGAGAAVLAIILQILKMI